MSRKFIKRMLISSALSLFAVSAIASGSSSPGKGCQKLGSIFPDSAHFEGTVVKLVGNSFAQTPVRAELTGEGSECRLSIGPIDGSQSSEVTFKSSGSDSMNVNVAELAQSFDLKLSGECFFAQSSTDVRLCPARNEIRLEVSQNHLPLYTLSLDSFADEPSLNLETPKTYTLADVMEHTFKSDFGTRVQLDRVNQARHSASNAYLNLLPHLSTNSILAIIATPISVEGIIAVVGDLAPFLLPSRWLKAKSAKYASEAEEDSVILMRADAGLQVEGFSYMIARDETLLQDYRDTLAQIDALKRQVQSREKLGDLPLGTSDNLSGTMSALLYDSHALTLTVSEQKSFLAQTAGFVSPQAILGVSTENTAPIESAEKLDSLQVINVSSTRSFELRQLDFLIEQGKSLKQASYFEWMDPSGDPTQGLGFGLGDAVAVEQSKIDELRTRREQVRTLVAQSASNAVAEYNSAVESFNIAQDDLRLQDLRVKRTLEMLQFGKDVSIIDLTSVYQDRLNAVVKMRSSEAQYRISKAKVDRLELGGFYSHLSADRE